MNRFFAISLLTLAIACLTGPAQSQSVPMAGSRLIWPGDYGSIGDAPLSMFGPPSLKNACAFVRMHDFETAKPEFETALSSDPRCMAAWVGLVQCEPEQWSAMVTKLGASNNDSPKTDELRFKDAVLLYYLSMDTPAKTVDDAKIRRAQLLFWHSWEQSKNVLSALFLDDSMKLHNHTGDPGVEHATANCRLLNQVLKLLAGASAFDVYQHARSSDWHLPPPPASLIIPQNLRPVLGIVAALRSSAGVRYGTGQMIDGKWVFTYSQLTEGQTRQSEYFKLWYENLQAAIRAGSTGWAD